MGTEETLTIEALKAIRESEILLGASRLIKSYSNGVQPTMEMINPAQISDFIRNSDYSKYGVMVSGDSGFFSLTKSLCSLLDGFETRVICGISSLQYLCSKLKVPWDDVSFLSLHGRDADIAKEVSKNQKLFVLTGGNNTVGVICERLSASGLGELDINVGTNLSQKDELISGGKVKDFIDYEHGSLSVMLIESYKKAKKSIFFADDDFIRGDVPMTKEEVRNVSVAKLRLERDDIVYDIGAGTGSVSIQIASHISCGKVYAVEHNPEALELIERNKEKFGADNLIIVQGKAPDICEMLPPPTKAFIGGSGGYINSVVRMLVEKNNNIRVVINVISLESLGEVLNALKSNGLENLEIVNVSVSKAKKAASHHIMIGNNPIYVITAEKNE